MKGLLFLQKPISFKQTRKIKKSGMFDQWEQNAKKVIAFLHHDEDILNGTKN